MFTIALTMMTLLADPTPKGTATPRKPHPLAPSLPELTDQEEAEFDRIVDRFIKADTGKLGGADGRSAMDAFKELGPEATFALIRGFNRSAHIDHSCPALSISRKLTSFLKSTGDIELLQYAKENVGAGVTKTRHGDVIRDVKMGCTQRITQLKNAPPSVLNNRPKP